MRELIFDDPTQRTGPNLVVAVGTALADAAQGEQIQAKDSGGRNVATMTVRAACVVDLDALAGVLAEGYPSFADVFARHHAGRADLASVKAALDAANPGGWGPQVTLIWYDV